MALRLQAYLDFSGGDVSNAKVGIKDLKVLDNVQGSVEWSNSKKVRCTP